MSDDKIFDPSTINEILNSEEQKNLYDLAMESIGDPSDFMKNPFESMRKMMNNPELMEKINKLSNDPKMKRIIESGMQNPMMKDLADRVPGFGNLYQRSQKDRNVQPSSNKIRKTLPWFSSELGPDKFGALRNAKKLSDLTQNLKPSVRSTAETMLYAEMTEEFGASGVAKLEEIAAKSSLDVGDYLVNVGAFFGHLVYKLTKTSTEDLSDLAIFALSSPSRPAPFPACSYAPQLLFYLDSFGKVDDDIIQKLLWTISANPANGKDAYFDFDKSDLQLLCEMLSDSEDVSLKFAVILALLQWSECRRALDDKIFALCLKSANLKFEDVWELLSAFLSGSDVRSVKIKNLEAPLARSLMDYLWKSADFSLLIAKAPTWVLPAAKQLHILCLQHLDLLWAKAKEEDREQYFTYLTESGDAELVEFAKRVIIHWQPDYFAEE